MSARYTKYHIPDTSAYTLIEILVALTVIGLLFSFGYASFRDFSRRQVLSDAAKTIQGDLRLAQSDATSGQKPADGSCNLPKTLDYYSFDTIPPSEYKIIANCGTTKIVVKDVTLASGITISNVPPSLQFKVLGQGTNIGDTDWILTLSQTGTANIATVTVTSGGEVK